MEKYLECVEGNSSKFWQIKVDGSKVQRSRVDLQ